MAISFPISLPSGGVKQITMAMVNKTSMSTSPFTGQQQVYSHPNEYWKAEIMLAQMEREDSEPWIAALASMRGMYGTMLLGDPAGATPQGTVSGSPVVDGASQTGFELDIKSMTGTFKAGDYIQLSNYLYKIVKDHSGATGTLEIWPRLRASPADGAAITYTNAKGLFRLTTTESPFTYVSPELASIQFSVIEAI